MNKTIAVAKTAPISRDELIAALRQAELHTPGHARTVTEITARVASRRGSGDVGLRNHHTATALRALLATPNSPVIQAVGSQVRFFARLPPRLGHTTVYYVWRTRAAKYKAEYDELLKRRAASITAAERWQEALGKHGTARAADATVIIEVPPDTALAMLAAAGRIHEGGATNA